MKNTLLIAALILIGYSSLNAQTWTARYDANVLPPAASPAWAVKDTAVSLAFVDSAKYLKFNAIPPTAKGDWYYANTSVSNATGVTCAWRVKATDELIAAYNNTPTSDYRIFEMEIRTDAVREQIWVLGRDSVSLIKAAVKGPVKNSRDWHIYRATIKSGVINIYVDENTTPVATGTTADANSDKQFRMGNQSTTIPGYGQYLDWVICDVTGAYSPSEKALPADLAAQIPTAVKDGKSVANSYKLEQNYPNPFNPSTKISFSLEKTGYTELSVYNMLGQKVASLISGVMAAGSHEFSFNAANLQSGVYVYQLKSGSFSQTRKMMLLK